MADAWARDPGTLELIFHEALRAHDAEGIRCTLVLLAACDPRRAETLMTLVRVAVMFGDIDPKDLQ